MEYLVRMTARAAQDLENIHGYIGADTIEKAADWFKELSEAVYSLESFPERGTAVHAKKKLRQIVFGDKPNAYKIVYAVDKRKRAVNILHIRHGAQATGSPE